MSRFIYICLLIACDPTNSDSKITNADSSEYIDALNDAWAEKERLECQDCQQQLVPHVRACQVFCKLNDSEYIRSLPGGCVCQNPSGHRTESSWNYEHCIHLKPECNVKRILSHELF